MRSFLGILVLALVLTVPGFSWAQKKEQAAFTEFLLQDLEYTLLSAPSPGGNPEQIKQWSEITHDRVHTLELLASDYKLSEHVRSSTTTVKQFLSEYRDFVGDLRMLGFVHEISTTQGNPTGLKTASRFLNVLSDGPMFLLGMEAEAMDFLDEKLVRVSFETKVGALKKAEVTARVERASEDFNRCMTDLSGYSAKLADALGTSLPAFSRPTDNAEKGPQVSGKPFSTVAAARSLVAHDRVAAAEKFLQAAGEVPNFGELSRLEFNELYRVPYARSAASLLEYEAGAEPARAEEFSKRAVQAFDRADTFAVKSVSALPYSLQVARARALARAGEGRRASQALNELATQLSDNPVEQAVQHYDLAVLHCLLGEDDLAMAHLKKSYAAKPRRDPYALRDPQLAPLVRRRAAEVEALVDHPLVDGEWADRATSSYIFDADGSLWQRRQGVIYTGKWKAEDGKLTLYSRSNGLDAGTGDYEILEGNRLQITANGVLREFSRPNRTGADNATIKGRLLKSDGSWVWADTQKPPPAFARFYVFRSLDNSKRDYWFIHEDPLLGRIHETYP